MRFHYIILAMIGILAFSFGEARAIDIHYTYDQDSRLTGARYGCKSITYQYDQDGNLVQREQTSAWQDITEMIQVRRSRTLFDRINRCFFVHLDLTNIYNEDITGPVRMVLENNNIPIEEDGPGLDPDGYTDDDHPCFIIVPAGETWQAGETLNDLRLDFMLQRTRLNFDLRFEALEE